MRDIYATLISAAHSGAFGMNGSPLPSLEQIRAGNYKKGRMTLHDLPIAIETPQGQRRTGKADGEPWSVICMAHYGYIVGTKASDGDAIDVYVGPVPESQQVFVINQNNASGAFDEIKVLLGFHDEASARTAYMNSYERDWKGLGSMIGATIDQFKWWLKFGDTSQPFTTRALPYNGNEDMNQAVWDSAANPIGRELADVIYQLRKDDSEGLLLDAVTAFEILEDADAEQVLDALVVEYAKVDRKADQLNKVMEANSGEVKPISVQVTPPFKQRGTTNVVILFELSDGQTVSIFMHNPDSTPNKILPADELVSWKWLLNKKDITVVVAPEKGQDLNPREVARRIMRLAEKNSARFTQANKGRADRMAAMEQTKSEISSKESALAALDAEVADLTPKVEAKRARVAATLQTNDQEGSVTNDRDTTATGVNETVVQSALPEGWSEVTPGGMATNPDEVRGGIVDVEIVSGKWFAIFNNDAIPNVNGLESRAAALAAVESALAKLDSEQTAGSDPVTIEQVADVMTRWDKDVLYAQTDANAEAGRIMVAAVENGWVSRRSTTQVDWTQVGVDALKAARADSEAAQEPQAFRHEGFNVYPVKMADGMRWAVQTVDNLGREQRGERQVGGDALLTTEEEAIAQAQWQIQEMADAAARAKAAAEEQAEEDAAKADQADTDGFADQFPQVQRDRIRATLAKNYNTRKGVMSLRNYVRSLVSEGRVISEWNGERILKDPESEGFLAAKEITKTGLDYAAYLISKREPLPEDDAELTAAKQYLQEVIDGSVDYMDNELATRLEQIHDAFADDESVMGLFNDAAQAYSDYMVDQARAALA